MANTPRKGGKDIEELETAFEKLSGKSAAKKQAAKSPVVPILIAAICVLAAIAVICGIIIAILAGGSSVKANVSVMGIELKGMSQNEAAEAITAEFDRLYGNQPMVLEIDGKQFILNPIDSSVDAQAAAEAAVNYKQASFKVVALDISEFISVSNQALEAIIDEAALAVNSELTQSHYEVTGTAPENLEKIDEKASQVLKITIGTPGKKLDKSLVLAALRLAYSNGQNEITYQWPRDPRYDIRYYPFPAGDTNFVYPGGDMQPLLSLRYMALRRSMEDYELLAMLRDAGQEQVVEELHRSILTNRQFGQFHDEWNTFLKFEEMSAATYQDYEKMRGAIYSALEMRSNI